MQQWKLGLKKDARDGPHTAVCCLLSPSHRNRGTVCHCVYGKLFLFKFFVSAIFFLLGCNNERQRENAIIISLIRVSVL